MATCIRPSIFMAFLIVGAPFGSLHASTGNGYTIGEALSHTRVNNPEIKRNAQVTEQAREQVNVALSNFLPKINYNYQHGRSRAHATSAQRWTYFTDRTRELRVEQPLFAGGSNWAGLQRAEHLLEASEFAYNSSEQAVLADAAAAYISLYAARQIVQFVQKNLAALQEQLELTNARYELRDVTLTDLSQAKARLALAEADYEDALEQLEQSAATFKRVVGIEAPAELAEPAVLYPLPETEEELIAALDENNPSIQQVQEEEQATEETTNAVFGELLPQVSLVGTSRRSDGDRLQLSSNRFDEDALIVNVSIPIYQGGGTRARLRSARHAAEEARYAVLQTYREVREEAILNWEGYKAAERIYKANAQAIEASMDTLVGMREEYSHGQRTLTDVLDAERELFRSEVGLARAQEQRLISAYRLLALLNAIKQHN